MISEGGKILWTALKRWIPRASADNIVPALILFLSSNLCNPKACPVKMLVGINLATEDKLCLFTNSFEEIVPERILTTPGLTVWIPKTWATVNDVGKIFATPAINL